MYDDIDVQGIENQAKADWDSSPEIRDEFLNDFECYKAYKLAEARGQFKIQSYIDRNR